jgi:hypothetical protein
MVDFHISLERNEYAAGETAKGTLIISAGRSLQLRGLKFYVCGEEISSITESKEYGSQAFALPTTYNEFNTFFYEDLSAFLLKSIGNIIRSDDDDVGGGNRLEVPKGVLTIPFEFTIPKYAYESYKGKYVSIIYVIIFTADKAWGKDVKEKIPFTVFNHNPMPTDDNIKEWGTDITVEGEGISLRLHLEDNNKNTFSPGDNIKGKLVVENSSGKSIKNAEIILSGIESTYASKNTRISTIEKYKQKVEFNEGEDSNSAPFEIHIPKEVKRSYKAVYSKYYWEIDAKLDIAGSRDLHVSTNIQIV